MQNIKSSIHPEEHATTKQLLLRFFMSLFHHCLTLLSKKMHRAITANSNSQRFSAALIYCCFFQIRRDLQTQRNERHQFKPSVKRRTLHWKYTPRVSCFVCSPAFARIHFGIFIFVLMYAHLNSN